MESARLFLLTAVRSLVLRAADTLAVTPETATLIPKGQASYTSADKEIKLKGILSTTDSSGKASTKDVSTTMMCATSPENIGMWTTQSSYDEATSTFKAPDSLDKGIKQVEVTLTCKSDSTTASKAITITVAEAKNDEWESRAIMGYHQAGASSADFAQNFFMDFAIIRGLGNYEHVYDNKWNLWGDVRIASSPQQNNAAVGGATVSTFASTFTTLAGNVQVNQLAMSAEYQIGFERVITKFHQGNRLRVLGGIAYGGADGSFSQPSKQAPTTFVVPSPKNGDGTTNQQYALFNQRFSNVIQSGAPYVAFLPPDRQRFYRQYGGGVRLTTFDLAKPYAPPATVALAFGQNELVSGGLFRGLVSRIDAFYPLPIGQQDGKFKFLFLFGTADKWWRKDPNQTQLVLIPATMTTAAGMVPMPVNDPHVYIQTVRNNRDTYKIGFGIDLVNLLNSWLNKQ